MLIYMLLNTVTERAYVGQTHHSLEHRVKDHFDAARHGSTSMLHETMRLWNEQCYWDAVVLQVCYDQRQLDIAEAAWQRACHVLEPGVGYNARRENLENRRGPGYVMTSTKPNSPIAGMSEDEARAWYREQGMKGAQYGARATNAVNQPQRSPKRLEQERRRAEFAAMTPEQRREYFRECGRRGAAASRKT